MKFKSLFFILVNFMFSLNVYAASNPYSQYSSYGTNCTWYAWKMAYEKGGVALQGFGNAKNWYSDAAQKGYSVGQTPKANSIVVWSNWTSYGHVGYVESVSGNTIYVYDSSQTCYSDETEEAYKNCIYNETVSADDAYKCDYVKEGKGIACPYSTNGDYTIAGYIYLDVAPTTKSSSTTTKSSSGTTSNSETKKTEEVKTKSSNTYLSMLKLSTGEIDFDKNVTSYDMEVENDISEVEVTADAEDKLSTVTGTGKYTLEIGKTAITLTVTAEDGSTKDYTINVIRKDAPIEEEDVDEAMLVSEEDTKRNSYMKHLLFYIIAVFAIIFSIVRLARIKKGHHE